MKLHIPRFHRIHLPAIFGSIIIASLLWLYVQLTAHYTYQIRVPITVSNIKEGKTLKWPISPALDVELDGPGSALLGLKLLWSTRINFLLNLETINKYWRCPTNNYLHWITLPQNLEEVNILRIVTPDTIYVELDDLSKNRKPVAGDNITIVPRSGYLQVGPITFSPDSADLSGPISLISTLNSIYTENARFSEAAGKFSREIPLEKFDNPYIHISPPNVRISFTIERIGERVFEGIPVAVVNTRQGSRLRIEPQTVRVTIHGGEQFIQNLTEKDIAAIITYQNDWKRNSSYQYPVQVTCPENVVYFEAVPQTIRIVVE